MNTLSMEVEVQVVGREFFIGSSDWTLFKEFRNYSIINLKVCSIFLMSQSRLVKETCRFVDSPSPQIKGKRIKGAFLSSFYPPLPSLN